ncbi:MAG: hypothetical protein O9353_14245, partial [Bacteroidia bacterium]|nr:hypothetical protein [Bacteroidia bacterium]
GIAVTCIMRNGLFQLYLIVTCSFFSFSAAAQEEEEEKKVNVNGLHFFHQYSFEHSFAEFDESQKLKAKTAFSIMPVFGVGIKRETADYVFAFSSKFGFQRDNMTFSYAGQKLAGTYAMDYMSVKRQFALGFRITPQQTFSFLFISSFNIFGMGATPFGEKRNLLKLEPKDKLQISTTDEPFLDYRIGFEYELKPAEEKKLRFFIHFESCLRQRNLEVAPNGTLGIDQPYTIFYRLHVLGYGMRF